MNRISILFVDLGNICRAPMAECIFLHMARQRGLHERFHVDSCGTGDFHLGKPPDPRALRVLTQHGISISGYVHRARQLQLSDLLKFDYVLCMDPLILGQVKQLATGITTTISPIVASSTTATLTTSPTGTHLPINQSESRIILDSGGGERQGHHGMSPAGAIVHCSIHLLGDFSYRNQLALNQKVDSKDFLVADPFYNPSEEPFEIVYAKSVQYVEAFLDSLSEKPKIVIS